MEIVRGRARASSATWSPCSRSARAAVDVQPRPAGGQGAALRRGGRHEGGRGHHRLRVQRHLQQGAHRRGPRQGLPGRHHARRLPRAQGHALPLGARGGRPLRAGRCQGLRAQGSPSTTCASTPSSRTTATCRSAWTTPSRSSSRTAPLASVVLSRWTSGRPSCSRDARARAFRPPRSPRATLARRSLPPRMHARVCTHVMRSTDAPTVRALRPTPGAARAPAGARRGARGARREAHDPLGRGARRRCSRSRAAIVGPDGPGAGRSPRKRFHFGVIFIIGSTSIEAILLCKWHAHSDSPCALGVEVSLLGLESGYLERVSACRAPRPLRAPHRAGENAARAPPPAGARARHRNIRAGGWNAASAKISGPAAAGGHMRAPRGAAAVRARAARAVREEEGGWPCRCCRGASHVRRAGL